MKQQDGSRKDLSDVLKECEFGATTGRQRMVGWLDLVEARRYVRLNHANSLAIMKLDKLSGANVIKVCVEYVNPQTGEKYTEMPFDNALLTRLRPVYKEFEGWNQDISECKSWEDLPVKAREYLFFIVDDLQKNTRHSLGLNVISVGPKRDQTIYLKPIDFVYTAR